MKTIINKDDRTVTVEKDGTSLTLTFTEAQDISETIDEEIYFKQDVINTLEDGVENGLYDSKVLNDDKLIDDVTGDYANLRRKNDGDAEGMPWNNCLNAAMEMSVLLKNYLIKNS